MFTFEHFLNLPLIWAMIIALAIFVYVQLDGFDLGVGIIYPFAPTEECRRRMINSIAPFWDGNETWLVLGGGGLFAAFPLAYSILFPAFYVPILLMLFALVFRGVAFEFHYKSGPKSRVYWDYAFHFGSLVAAFSQGMILGAFVQGVDVSGREFAGSTFDWLTPFSVMTGFALVMGYALLGSTWLIMKTDGQTQTWAHKVSKYVTLYVIFFMFLVSVWVPFLKDSIYLRWFSLPNFGYLAVIPILTLFICVALIRSVRAKHEHLPFFLTHGLFTLCYIGLMISLYPWMVPHQLSYYEVAAAPESQSFLLIGAIVVLPVIFIYTAYVYYVFRGKTSHESLYS